METAIMETANKVRKKIKELSQERILILDGAMGSLIQERLI
jgi:methionine synthase I (cobalamin-dependent)